MRPWLKNIEQNWSCYKQKTKNADTITDTLRCNTIKKVSVTYMIPPICFIYAYIQLLGHFGCWTFEEGVASGQENS